ncbi:MAG: helix-turn-helix transcriptional regulator [Clostridia bacterium]|nr:helix-turn-helix transcriptional regulator [Clostridia bacterium]
MDQIKIGKFIAELRKEQKMTQLDLATKIGVTDRAISKWENGRGLPDIALINPLCETLSISINELLEGERIDDSQEITVAHKNLIHILGEREREKRKGKNRTLLISILMTFVILVCIMFAPMLYAQWRGDGYSFSAALATREANFVVKAIMNHDFSKAAQSIGFWGKDRSVAEKQWSSSMKNLCENELSITHFTVTRMTEDDRFVSGYATMVVYDYESHKKYVFDFQTASQDGGIVFGYPTGMFEKDWENEEDREYELMLLISDALCTWYAG